MEILDKYLNLLWELFLYDVEVFSQPWIYYWICLPALGYVIFFWLKWILLTAPIWLPVRMALSGAISFFRFNTKSKKKDS